MESELHLRKPSAKIQRGTNLQRCLKQKSFESYALLLGLAMKTYRDHGTEKFRTWRDAISKTLQLEMIRKDGTNRVDGGEVFFIRDENQQPVVLA